MKHFLCLIGTFFAAFGLMAFLSADPIKVKVTLKDGCGVAADHYRNAQGGYDSVGTLDFGEVRAASDFYGDYVEAKILAGKTNVGADIIMWFHGQTNGIIGGPKATTGVSVIKSFDKDGKPVLAGWSLWPGDKIQITKTFITWFKIDADAVKDKFKTGWVSARNVEQLK